MRTYTVHYLKEINDQCVDCEIEIEEINIGFALFKFRQKIQVFKRITAIIEKPTGR